MELTQRHDPDPRSGMELTQQYDPEDDWTGLASKAERRRRQNRLNQRANRLRKHMRRFATEEQTDSATAASSSSPSTALTTTTSTALTTTTTAQTTPLFFFFADRAALAAAARPLRPGALADLVRLNVLHALALNAAALGIPVDALADYDALSPVAGPLRPVVVAAPLLVPTALQRAVPHHPWVDLLPVPRLRDNILLALAAGTLDEDEMCYDISAMPDSSAPYANASCADDGSAARGALTVWGDACDVRNWEYSPAFLRKWLWLFDGCDEVFQATDSWRARRGERRIGFRTRAG